MKKLTLVLAVITLSITIFSCNGGNSEQKNTTSQKEKLAKNDIKKELIVSLTIGGEEIKLIKADIRNNAMTPGQKSNDYTINATPEGSDDSTDEVVFSIDFTTTGQGEATDTYMTLKKYKINNVSVNINKIETKKGTYGGVNITSIKGSFKGQLKKTNKMGFPIGDLIKFNGTFEK